MNWLRLVIALVAGVAAAAVVAYLILPRPTGAPQPGRPESSASSADGVTRALSKGAMAAFVVKPKREILPDIAFEDGGGNALRLSQWKGRVVLLNLWATWCAPCRKEMPELNALQQKLGGKDFEVVALSVDRKGGDVSGKFLSEVGATALKLYVDPSTKALTDLKAPGLPSTFLIDREGREIGRLVGPAHWASPEAMSLIQAALEEKK